MVINQPPIAPVNTITQDGSFQNTSMLKRIAAKAKSIGAKIELVQIGLLNAAIRIPTTAAFTPISAPFTLGLRRNVFQKGSVPKISRNEGKNIAKVANNPPCQPFMTAPR